MADRPETKGPKLPRNFTQTSFDVQVIDVTRVELSQNSDSVLREKDSGEAGTRVPIEIVLRTLGSPLFYRVETFEITAYGCVIFCHDQRGQYVNLTPGSSLVDGLILLPDSPESDPPQESVHFIGKVLDKVNLLAPGKSIENENRTGFVIRFSQMARDDASRLAAFLNENSDTAGAKEALKH